MGPSHSVKSDDNFFDPLRHLAAMMVLFSHHFPLSGRPEPTFPGWETAGTIAVIMFFAISGFFMPQSHRSAGDYLGFMRKRCRRIFPGLVVCSFVMVYFIGATFTKVSLFRYLFDVEQVKTFLLFASLSGRYIPTVFDDFTFKSAINGSLWTLPIEFLWYIIIGSVLSISASWRSAAGLLWLSFIGFAILNWSGQGSLAFYGVSMIYLALFGVSFSMGALLSMTKDTWMPYRGRLVFAALLLVAVARYRPETLIVGAGCVAVLTIIAGVSIPDRLIRQRFDLSYGIYIYAFPIQQIVINCISRNFWFSMLLAAVFTVIAASFSYHFIEKPFLRRRAPHKPVAESVASLA